jgi:hypothetical protein
VTPTVSFVIPVRNDAARLARCLRTIRANAAPGHDIEIVVCDNGSRDDSADVARAAGARVLSLPGLPVSELRNQGARAASGRVLAFVDADHEIAPDWVAAALDVFAADEAVAAVGAMCDPPAGGTWVQRTYGLLRRRPAGARDVEWLGSGNLAMRRDAFDRAGGFDTSLETCEDVDLCHRVRREGYRIREDSRLRNVHLGDPSTLGELFRGELWRGRDNLRVSLRAPFAIRELPSVLIPVADLVFLAAGVVGIALGSRPGLLTAGLAAGGIMSAAAARATRIVSQDSRTTLLGCGQALAVALVYDCARAFALVGRVGHDARKGKA